jgi:hypothetical protein
MPLAHSYLRDNRTPNYEANMHTEQEILSRMKEVESRDWLGTQRSDLMEFLSYVNAKQFLKEDTTAEKWAEVVAKRKSPAEQIREYLPFAWDKANNCRGISAGRSIDHMMAWLWLDGKDDLAKECEDYNLYGKPQLAKISDAYGVDWRKLDNDCWTNEEGERGITADEALAG